MPATGLQKSMSKMANKLSHAAACSLLAGLLFLFAGCGYRFAGSGNLPGGVRSVAVQVPVNSTAETGLENMVTRALVDELARRKHRIVPADRADAVLSGKIENLWLETVTHKEGSVSQERRVKVAVFLTLRSQAGDKLWSSGTLTADWTFDVVNGNKAATDANRRKALEEVVRKLAETAYARMTGQF